MVILVVMKVVMVVVMLMVMERCVSSQAKSREGAGK